MKAFQSASSASVTGFPSGFDCTISCALVSWFACLLMSGYFQRDFLYNSAMVVDFWFD